MIFIYLYVIETYLNSAYNTKQQSFTVITKTTRYGGKNRRYLLQLNLNTALFH